MNLHLAYLASLVKGSAYARLQDHIGQCHGFLRIPDLKPLLPILAVAFGEPDESGTAEREIKALRQRISDFAT